MYINEIDRARELHVVKSNDLATKTRLDLSTQEYKILLFIISKIEKDDTEFKINEFSINEYAEVCGISTGGRRYKLIKESLKKIADKSFWIKEGSEEVLYRWFESVKVDKSTSKIKIQLHQKLAPYMLNLKNMYLDYRLYDVLAMKSQYGIRLYELLKAEFNLKTSKTDRLNQSLTVQYDLDELKRLMNFMKYKGYGTFHQSVITPAQNDINEYSDIHISVDTIKKGRTVTKVIFMIRMKDMLTEGLETHKKIEEYLNHNLN